MTAYMQMRGVAAIQSIERQMPGKPGLRGRLKIREREFSEPLADPKMPAVAFSRWSLSETCIRT